MNIKKTYPYILFVGGLLGLLASLFLTIDTIKLIKNPEADLPCNINPFISCGNAILSDQGQIFGFPNPLLGIISFSIIFSLGLMLLSEGRANKNFWVLVNYGTLASMVFVIWFFYESLYQIGSLCPYCALVWIVTWPIFLYTTVWNIKEGNFSLHRKNDEFLLNHHIKIFVAVYLVATLLIFIKFKDFFLY